MTRFFFALNINARKETDLKWLFALFALCALSANASTTVDVSPALTRSSTVSSTNVVFFKLDPTKETVVEVSGTGAGTLKVSTAYDTTPSTYNGFTPDPDGSVSGNTGWRLPKGMSFAGFDASSGTWTMRVAQPK